MAHRRADVVDAALDLLAAVGLPDLTMRQLGAELDVRPSAIYHHFPSKQALLGAVADEILARGRRPVPRELSWDERLRQVSGGIRGAVLAYPDGADVVATMFAFGLGGAAAYDELRAVLRDAGSDPDLAGTGSRTLLHFIFGHAIDEQAHRQASRLGAIDTPARGAADFDTGLALIIDGLRAHVS